MEAPNTPPRKTKIEPENGWLEDVFPISSPFFRGDVNFPGVYFVVSTCFKRLLLLTKALCFWKDEMLLDVRRI